MNTSSGVPQLDKKGVIPTGLPNMLFSPLEGVLERPRNGSQQGSFYSSFISSSKNTPSSPKILYLLPFFSTMMDLKPLASASL